MSILVPFPLPSDVITWVEERNPTFILRIPIYTQCTVGFDFRRWFS